MYSLAYRLLSREINLQVFERCKPIKSEELFIIVMELISYESNIGESQIFLELVIVSLFAVSL